MIEADTEHLDEMDVVVPVDKVAEFLEHVHQIGEKYGVGIRSFGHAGDGNLHIYASANGVDQDVIFGEVPEGNEGKLRKVHRA